MTEFAVDKPIGYKLPPITRTFTQDKMNIYRNHLGMRVKELSAPVKDFHTDTEEARKLGMPKTMAESLHYYEFVAEIAANFFGKAWFTSGKLSSVFLRPVYVDDVITAGAAIKEKVSEGQKTRIVLETWCDNQNSERVAAGTASALIE